MDAPDVHYVERVSASADRLMRTEIKTRQDISRTQQELVRVAADVELEMESLKRELLQLDHDVKQTVERVKSTVSSFKTVVKKGDFQRLQQRIDLWAPEQRITREQFKKMLEERA